MKPYYEHAGITIYHGDCRDLLPALSGDALVTDPPYGIDLGVGKDMRGGPHGLAKHKYECYDDTYDNFKTVVVPAIAVALTRVKRGAVFTGPHVQDLPKTETFAAIHCPAATGRHRWGFNTMLLIALYGIDPALHLGPRPTLYRSVATAEDNGHPCPKPLAWMLWLINRATLPGETVLDPFMGSGTTLRAAKDTGRVAIGIELSERYCEIAAKRLAQEVLPLEHPA